MTKARSSVSFGRIFETFKNLVPVACTKNVEADLRYCR